MSGYIYFIAGSGRIKIGFSANPKNRLKDLSTSSAHDLDLLCTFEGSIQLERAIHRHLKSHRIRLEWFEDCPAVRDLMKLLLEHGGSAIGFTEPPPLPKQVKRENPVVSVRDPFVSPLRPAQDRISACMDRYIGVHISAARQREKEMNLPPGELINPLIGGFYSVKRSGYAAGMIVHTIDCMEGLLDEVLDSLSSDDKIPLDQQTLLPTAIKYADRLEKGLEHLFADPDIAIIDLTPYGATGH